MNTYVDRQTPCFAETLSSFAAICAKYAGHVSDWLHILPSPASAQAAFDALPPDTQARLVTRASNYGLEAWELMQKLPQELWDNPEMLNKFLSMFDISHFTATSVDPTLAGDQGNWTWEMRGTNRSRQARSMNGTEHREAVNTANETAETMTGEAPFWEWNDIWHGFLDAAEMAGLTSAWLPKDDWKKLMAFCQDIHSDMKAATTFNQKLKAARLIAIRIKSLFGRYRNHLVCAFLLGILTLQWPPVQWFLATWALVGLAGFVVSILRVLTRKGMGYKPIAAIAKACDVRLAGIFNIIKNTRAVFDMIKDGIFYVGVHAYDLIFGRNSVWTKTLQPAVKTFIEHSVHAVKTAAASVKSALSGFINWLSSIF